MAIAEILSTVRYVVNANGERTDIVVPLDTWNKLLANWKALVEQVEEEEDAALLQEWLTNRAMGQTDMISLDAMEQELAADGLLVGTSTRQTGHHCESLTASG